jgi:hypothetical protein
MEKKVEATPQDQHPLRHRRTRCGDRRLHEHLASERGSEVAEPTGLSHGVEVRVAL